ncbi:ABC transporter permease [Acholeplasma hippikon]|uniref:ABC-type uncharacterized transport system, permease component n=1 Tax=Acholeplasma hippikon TaxID=264636 RepID=A0A449BI14_9MOLU|nr:ABC-2 family transporter protein [Acholeplasma hippikon]VEU82101.1 ABC-type uncharacterized transport system, permease component [Acholeplasma hippikon]
MKIKSIKKYLAFTKAGILDGFAYKFNAFGWFLGDVFTILILYFLWQAVYKNSPTDIINGMTFSQMVTYLILARVCSPLIFNGFSFWQLGYDIYEGNIAINLIKPINYRRRTLFSTLGGFIANFILLFLPISVIVFIIFYFLLGVSIPSIPFILLFLLSAFLACIIYDALNFMIAELAIFTNALFGLMLIKDTVLGFLSGSLLPISFFPSWLQGITKYLPFRSIAEVPIMILMEKYSYKEILLEMVLQVVWIVILNLCAQLSFNQIKKHIVSAGG